MSRLIVILLFVFISGSLFSQNQKPEPPLTRILFVFDASQSMQGTWEKSIKITSARDLLIEMIDSLKQLPNLEMALRVYGHQSPVPPQDCGDTRLEVPFSKNNVSKIKTTLRTISPKGTTPIARSLEQSAKDFPACDNCRNVIILITDGIEACEGDPCAVSMALQKQGIVLKPFVIGIGLDVEFKKTFECVGRYYDASNEQTFRDVLGIVISQALNATTAQVNLLDEYGKPSETNVNMSFYDRLSGKLKYNYVHTINNRGVPDTLILDPLVKYRLIVHTIPPVMVDSIELTPGKHTIIAADAPQGYLNVQIAGGMQYNSTQYLIRKAGDSKTLNVDFANNKEKYIVGKYDLEILTLPRINVEKVDISQNKTTTIDVPKSGVLNMTLAYPGFGSIYLIKGKKMEWVCNTDPEAKKESISLQPGDYKLVFRTKHAKESIQTIDKSFTKISGSSVLINLN